MVAVVAVVVVRMGMLLLLLLPMILLLLLLLLMVSLTCYCCRLHRCRCSCCCDCCHSSLLSCWYWCYPTFGASFFFSLSIFSRKIRVLLTGGVTTYDQRPAVLRAPQQWRLPQWISCAGPVDSYILWSRKSVQPTWTATYTQKVISL